MKYYHFVTTPTVFPLDLKARIKLVKSMSEKPANKSLHSFTFRARIALITFRVHAVVYAKGFVWTASGQGFTTCARFSVPRNFLMDQD